MHTVLTCSFFEPFSSSSSEDTPVANAFELKARDPGDEDDVAAKESHSVSSKQTVAPASSPEETAEVHVSTLEHNYPIAPEPRVNYL